MAKFGNSKKQEKAVVAKAKASKTPFTDGREHDTLIAPWFSEKALIGTEKGVYVFHVSPRATKHDVAKAIVVVYKVTPKKVRMVNLPAKKVSMRTRRGHGTRAARSKAYVYLKKGETINLA